MKFFSTAKYPHYRYIGIRKSVSVYLFLLLAIYFSRPGVAFSQIHFEEVSTDAGIIKHIPTAASSWGDFNGDGWPDLWVSNHHANPPSLYLNQGDGKFLDIAKDVIVGDPRADFHGAAWADFDDDGDRDLLVTTGGGAGRGISPNFVFVNENGKLIDKAKELRLDIPKGRGRLPVWFDANNDGKLDVLVVNSPREDAPSAIFVQTESGVFTEFLSIKGARKKKSDKSIFSGLISFISPGSSNTSEGISVNEEFAQVSSISGTNGNPDIFAYLNPTKILSVPPNGLVEVAKPLRLPRVNTVQDIAIDDFNGDGRFDLFIVRGQPWAVDIQQSHAREIRGKFKNGPNQTKEIRFRSGGSVTFGLYRPWIDPSDPAINKPPVLRIGSQQLLLEKNEYTISTKDAHVKAEDKPTKIEGEFIAIKFDNKSQQWHLKSSLKLLNFVIQAEDIIETLDTKEIYISKGDLEDILLFRSANGFTQQHGKFMSHTSACSSVAAGDFDNDMDIDLFLVCSSPIQNLPNILYENNGKGVFKKVLNAAGAGGSTRGVGNQVAIADFDRDGFLDLFVTNGAGPPPFAEDGPHQLFRNKGNTNNWLEIDLTGKKSNREGIGALIIVETNGVRQIRQQTGGMHSFSQNHSRLHFGLGQHKQIDKVIVNWPSGTVQTLKNIEANQILQISEE